MTSRRQKAGLVIGLSLLAVLASLPVLAGTKTYPMAVVQGNSMYPTLQNGELVIFAAPKGPIQNGTIIVFVQGSTGVSTLDAFLKPIVIHRVVSVGQEPSGMADYQTKGDNNLAKDPFVTDKDQVLGVPVLTVPLVGFPILFLQTPYGMVATTALLCLYFLSGVDTKLDDEAERKRLLAVFARECLNGAITPAQFERLKLAVEYYEDLPIDLLSDPTIVSVVDWMKECGPLSDWKEEEIPCPTCGSQSVRIVSGSEFFLICPSCGRERPPQHSLQP